MAPSLQDAIDGYLALLQERHLESTAGALSRAVREQNLVWLGRPLCSVLRPCFVPRTVLRRARRAALLVSRGLGVLARALLQDPALRRDAGLCEGTEDVIRTGSGSVREIVGRLDGFIDPGGVLRFIEYNPDPGAVANYYRLSRLFAGLPVMRDFAARYRARNASTWLSLSWTVAAMALRPLLTGGVTVIWSGAAPEDPLSRQLELEVEAARRAARRLGLRMDVARLHDLRFVGERAFLGRRAVSTAYVTDWEGLRRAFPLGHPFWRATAAGALCVLNSWPSQVVRGDKRVFGLLSDPGYRGLFDGTVAAALDVHVPWTRPVRARWTTWRGERIDLPSFVAKHRRTLVLKPATALGGKGVVLGWLSSEAEWSAALERGLATPHVVQERVPERREPYAVLSHGRLEVRDYATDFNAFIWNARVPHGYMARVSDGTLMNVTAGSGSLTPVFSVPTGP